MITSYLRYLFHAKDEHSLHSPFVFELYTKVIQTKKTGEQIAIEQLRRQLKQENRSIQVRDFGAGSGGKRKAEFYEKKIKTIAQKAEKAPKFGQLFYRLIQHFSYKYIFDLGTSLGITTAYEASADSKASIVTFEGCPATAQIAQENFEKLGLKNIEIVVGNLDETLAKKVNEIPQLDFVFFDANHRYEPTIRYFELCLPKAHEESLFVFDDIYWSKEMTQAWQEIKHHPDVRVTIDLFFVGLVFFRKKQPKQDFILKF